jgi:hypothetical protein
VFIPRAFSFCRRCELRKRPSRLGNDDIGAIDEPTAMIDLSKSAANGRRQSFACHLTIVARAYVVLIVAGLFAHAEALRAHRTCGTRLAIPRQTIGDFFRFSTVIRLQPSEA